MQDNLTAGIVIVLLALVATALMRQGESKSSADQRYQELLERIAHEHEANSQLPQWSGLLVAFSAPFAVFAVYLRHKKIISSKMENERKMNKRIRYGFLGLILTLLAIIKTTVLLKDRLLAPSPHHPLFTFWLSLNPEMKAATGICAFLAALRLRPVGSQGVQNNSKHPARRRRYSRRPSHRH